MGFSSFDSIINSVTSEKTFRVDWWYKTNNEILTNFSSINVDLGSHFSSHGTPNLFPGTSLSYVSCNESAGNGTQIFGIPHGGNVSTDTKHIVYASTMNPSYIVGGIPSSSPAFLTLVDLQGYWANINYNTTTTQNLTGSPGSTLRYTNGEGCRLYLVCTSSVGTTANTLSITYRNTAGTSKTVSNIPYLGGSKLRSVILNNTESNMVNQLFISLNPGDTGVSNCESITFNGAVTGTGALCLARPLITLPIYNISNFTESEFVHQTPSLPRVRDGACLVWLFSGSALSGNVVVGTSFSGDLQFAWG